MLIPFTMPEYLQDQDFYYFIDEEGRLYQLGKRGDHYWEIPVGTRFFYAFKQYKRHTCKAGPASEIDKLMNRFKPVT
jgi:hypothetical protein